MPLVAFEGIDGSGKSTTLARVADRLRAQGLDPLVTREETEGPTGAWVRQSIAEGWPVLATTFLFAADRARHVAELRPQLDGGRLVLCDRYVHSTYAYQGVTLAGAVDDPVGFLRRLHEGWCPRPDLVLLFRTDPAKAVARTERRGSTTPYEKAGFLAKVQARYLALAEADPASFRILDADRDLDTLERDALRHLQPLLQAKPE